MQEFEPDLEFEPDDEFEPEKPAWRIPMRSKQVPYKLEPRSGWRQILDIITPKEVPPEGISDFKAAQKFVGGQLAEKGMEATNILPNVVSNVLRKGAGFVGGTSTKGDILAQEENRPTTGNATVDQISDVLGGLIPGGALAGGLWKVARQLYKNGLKTQALKLVEQEAKGVAPQVLEQALSSESTLKTTKDLGTKVAENKWDQSILATDWTKEETEAYKEAMKRVNDRPELLQTLLEPKMSPAELPPTGAPGVLRRSAADAEKEFNSLFAKLQESSSPEFVARYGAETDEIRKALGKRLKEIEDQLGYRPEFKNPITTRPNYGKKTPPEEFKLYPTPREPAPPIKEELMGAAKEAAALGKDVKTDVAMKGSSQARYLERHGAPHVVAPIYKAIGQKDEFVADYTHRLTGIFDKYNLKQKERSKIVARLLNGDEIEATPDLKMAADEIRQQIFDPIYYEISKDPELANMIGPVRYVKEYFPHIQEALIEKYGVEKGTMFVHDLRPAGLKARFFKDRWFDDEKFNTNLPEVMKAYIQGAGKTLFDLKAYDTAVKQAETLDNPALKDYAARYLANYMGQPSSAIGKFRGAASDLATKAYYLRYIGLNPYSAATNLTQTWFNTIPEIGYKATGAAVQKLFHPNAEVRKSTWEAVRKSGIFQDYPGLEESTGLANKFLDTTFFGMFKGAEKVNRAIAYVGGLDRAKVLGLTGADARDFARNVVRKTQFYYGKKDPIPLIQNSPSTWMFANFPLKQGEFLRDTIRSGDKGKIARLAAQYGTGALGASAATGFEKDPLTATAGLMFDVVPGPGPIIKDMADFGTYLYRLGQQEDVDWGKESKRWVKTAGTFVPGASSFRKLKKTWEGKK